MSTARVEAMTQVKFSASTTFGETICAPLLKAADAADREQGIHRVRVDDAAVERVARALVRHRWPTALGDVWGSLGQGTQDDTLDQARVVLAALIGAKS